MDSPNDVRSSDPPRPVYAWFVVGILVCASLISYIDRQVVAIVVGPMKADLQISDSEVGWLYGIFAIFYAIAGLPIAWLADRYDRGKLIAAGIFIWSLLTMACGFTRTFGQVILARIGVGVGEAVLVPSANSLISDYFARERVPLAISVFQSGSVLGSAIAFLVGGWLLGVVERAEAPLLPFLAGLAPWQQVFVYVGAPGILLVPLILLIREPLRRGRPGRSVPGERSEHTQLVIQFYRQNTATILLHHAGFLALSLMGFCFTFWTVSYFTRVHGMQASVAAQVFGWIFLVAGPFGGIWAAMLAERFARRGRKDANITAAMIGAMLVIPIILLIQVMPSPAWAFALYVPAMFFSTSPYGLAYGSLPVIAPPQIRATVTSVFMVVTSLGMLLGPPLAGMFNERIFPATDGIRYSLMSVTSLFGAFGVTMLALCRKHYARSLTEAAVLDTAPPAADVGDAQRVPA